VITVRSITPEADLTRGAVQFTSLDITDDYIEGSSNGLSLLYTSLNNLEKTDGRNLLSDVISEQSQIVNRFTFNYPEAEGFTGSLEVNGSDYWVFENNKTQFISASNGTVSTLKLSIDGHDITYQIDVYSSDICSPAHRQYTITPADLSDQNGVLRLNDYQPVAGRIIITPIVNGVEENEFFIRKIRISKTELPGSLSYFDEGIEESVSTSEQLQLLIKDFDSESTEGFISLGARFAINQEEITIDQFYPSLAIAG